ncbi:hypothetical protein MWT96_07535 [Prescottella equi]|uniref:Uncharacterized protein n=1 Tax=Rhodococcus hoagii TaxID=43767 RepID=A0A9Q4ZU74_RHOHA|nr:hypothetical protein [Prescottella equi]MBM4487294.1 hypothetical protein [Prescottella equi]MBM4487641.1 hypothetical protein [Prescottella equi]MBM4500604.1 hypothetical protein [Prescottella equi]MBM4508052.1 hypothetical protein [Prescottella equi]MBM4514491.1 hypothetical protein [Prescottella equi]
MTASPDTGRENNSSPAESRTTAFDPDFPATYVPSGDALAFTSVGVAVVVVVELGVEVVVVVVVDGPVVVVAFGVEAVAVAVAVVDAPVVVVVVVDGPVVAVGVDDALLVVVVGAGVTVVEVGSAARAANIPSEDAPEMLEIWSLQSRFQIVGWLIL